MPVASGPSNQIDLVIRGMHCASCSAAVERALRNTAGVAAAAVNLATGRATVQVGGSAAGAVDALLLAVQAAGYRAELFAPSGRRAGGTEHAADLRKQRRGLLVGFVCGVPLITLHLAHLVAPSSGFLAGVLHAWGQTRVGWAIQGVLALLVFAAAARETFRAALRSLLTGSATMDVLVSMGALTAFLSGVVGSIAGDPTLVVFDAAAMIVLFVGLGKYFEARARRRASAGLEALAARIPDEALRVVEGGTETVPVADVRPDDLLRVPAHTLVPVDGTVVDGHAAVDESLLTGEAVPVARKAGDLVFGGTRIVDGLLDVRATATGAESAAARIAQLVEQAQMTKPPWQRLADRAAGVFVPVVVLLALATFGGWWWLSDGGWAVQRAIAVLVVACPCALGLAIPTAVMVGTARAAEHGILVRDAAVLEAAGAVREVLLDKTGTLTLGQPVVESIESVGPLEEKEALRLAAALEQLSGHPLARAIVQVAKQRGLTVPEAEEFSAQAGGGVRGRVDGTPVVVGTAQWLDACGVPTADWRARAAELAARGTSLVWVACAERVVALIVFADALHPESAAAVEALHKLGVRTRILSGDRHASVSRVADQLGIDAFEAELTPAEKLARVREAVAHGGRVAMVGDGINDAPALAAADVGIAIGTGADVARQAAPICLVGHSPRLIPETISVSRASARIMKQNLVWACAYNLVMLPVAILTALPPVWATAAMMLSSLSVVANSLRLRHAL